MENIVKSDIFFFVTAISVSLVTIVLVIVGAYCVRIASDLRHIVARTKEESDEVMDDLKTVRESIKEKGKLFGAILSSLLALRGKKKKHTKRDDK